ncbi:Lsr2 family protein [Microbacterium sp. SLBN-146]|uniref:histone-like nucleoid-structuring protein Lsr2 n=1 Tax=Microbacterium sp. SLBN-146 TaxID=2768457 RepID=UPI00114E9808|nr:Lsr2 family protein [Microbacterium sp. SLBN-146]TQJ31129.1 Lsr2 protein [Microbacterium sp. SLBN-146]
MATRILRELVDDIDGLGIGQGEGRTLHFSFDGTDYTIDLRDENISRLRDALNPFINAARNAAPPKKNLTISDADLRMARRWARDHGFDVGARGRLPRQILEEYVAATR